METMIAAVIGLLAFILVGMFIISRQLKEIYEVLVRLNERDFQRHKYG